MICVHVVQDQCLRILHGFVERLECVTEGGRQHVEAAEDIDGVYACLCFMCMCDSSAHMLVTTCDKHVTSM